MKVRKIIVPPKTRGEVLEAVIMTPTKVHHLNRQDDSFIYTGEQPTAIYIIRTNGSITCHKVEGDFTELEIMPREKTIIGIKVHNASGLKLEKIAIKFYEEYTIAAELLKKNGIELAIRNNENIFIEHDGKRLKRKIENFLCGQSKERINTITNEDKENIHIFYVKSVNGRPDSGVVCNAPSPHIILGQECSGTLLIHELGHTFGLSDIEASEINQCVCSLLSDETNIMQPYLTQREHLKLGQSIHAHVCKGSILNDQGRCSPTLDWAWNVPQCGDNQAPPINYPDTYTCNNPLCSINPFTPPGPPSIPSIDPDISPTDPEITSKPPEQSNQSSENDVDLSDNIIQDLLCECAHVSSKSEERLKRHATNNEEAYSIIHTIAEQGDYKNKIEAILRRSIESVESILAKAQIDNQFISENYIEEIKRPSTSEEIDKIIEERKKNIQQRAEEITKSIELTRHSISTSYGEETSRKFSEIRQQKTKKAKQPRRRKDTSD